MLTSFFVDFDYLKKKLMFESMWRDEYLLHCNVRYIIKTHISFSCYSTDSGGGGTLFVAAITVCDKMNTPDLARCRSM